MKFKVYRDALVTYEWFEEVEAETAEDAIEIVEKLAEAVLDASIDPYTATEGPRFAECDFDGQDWGAERVEFDEVPA